MIRLATLWTCITVIGLGLTVTLELRAEDRFGTSPFAAGLTFEPEPFVVLPVGFEEPAALPEPAGLFPTASVTNFREQLRESVQREGAQSESQRDSLTQDVVQLIKWTASILLLASGGLFTMKRFGLQPVTQQATGNMKIVDTLKIGRHQGLHLVEVGGERFVVAADPGGIRAVTLLPNWPGAEPETAA